MFMKHYAPNRCEPIGEMGGGGERMGGCKPRIEVIVKMQKKKSRGGGWGCPVGGGWGGSGGCEPRIEVIVKMQTKIGGRGGGMWGQGECEPRIEVIVKMQKKKKSGWGIQSGWGGGGEGGGIRVDVNQELK